MEFASLGSGSSGNCTVIRWERHCLLIDCGFSLRETTLRLARMGVAIDDVTDILVTHEHSDHLAGVSLLANRVGARVHISEGTCQTPLYAKRPVHAHLLHRISAGQAFNIGGVDIDVVGVPHDANEPVQFTLTSSAGKLGVISDLGHAPESVVQSFRGCHALLLEHNHDAAMLANGPYPYSLKRRVGGPLGHLSNIQAAQLLQALIHDDLQQVVAIHLSETNNADYLVTETVETVCGNNVPFTFITATQVRGVNWMRL